MQALQEMNMLNDWIDMVDEALIAAIVNGAQFSWIIGHVPDYLMLAAEL